ncbi:DUF3332 family protein [Geobacter sp.]|uniref:DUF3332 family protein n=1 Tax=Geobacter sp. TaxID=46610 RepID=UPI00261E6891|nr:DUF3332 family protein [Geobacter sp.]
MKRLAVWGIVLALSVGTLGGCFGRFALVRKIYQVNSQVNDKYVRSLVTWAFIIIPVYQVSGLVDFLVFNTIEFWKGSNPIAEGEKTLQYAEGDRRFIIHARKDGELLSYTIDRYEGDRYVDSVTVSGDLRTGDSRAIHREFGRTTEYAATPGENGLQPEPQGAGLELLARYR